MVIADYCLPLPDLQPLFFTAVILSFAVISFLFMLGRILSKSEWEGIARKELKETMIAIVISVVVVGLAGASCESVKFVLSDHAPGYTQFTYSYKYLNVLINDIGTPAIQSLWSISYLMKNFKGKSSIGGALTIDWFALASTYGTVLERLSGLLFAFFIGSLNAQLILLQIAQAFAITLILPVGVVLRAIPFTRSGGSFLIALSFGLYIVLPLMYVVNYDISKQIWPGFDEYISVPWTTQVYSGLSSFLERAILPIETITKIIPQASILALLNLTVFQSFVGVFTRFLDDIS